MADKAGVPMTEFVASRVRMSFLVEDLENAKRDLLQQLDAKEKELQTVKSQLDSKEKDNLAARSELEQSKQRSLELEHEIQVLRSEEL